MKSTRLTLVLFASFTLLISGCSSLRPPPPDPSAWNGVQIPPREAQTQTEAWADGLASILYDLGIAVAH